MADLVSALSKCLPSERISESPADRICYSRDLWPRHLIDLQTEERVPEPPAAIVWPTSDAEIAGVVEFARQEGYSLLPFGAGSGVCGAILPNSRTLVVDLKRMRDFRVDPEGPSLEVEAGALGIELEEELARRGYTLGHFPSSILCSTVGGWLATRSAGQCSGRYGKIEDMGVALDVVLGSGEGVRFRRRQAGPSLLPLMVGSEGTLGVISRAVLRLHPAPAARAFAAFSFSDVLEGCAALRHLFQSGLRPAVSRLYDPFDSMMLRHGSKRPPKARPPSSRFGPARELLSGALLRSALRVPLAVNAAIRAGEHSLWRRAILILVFEGSASENAADMQAATGLCRAHGGQALGESPAVAWYAHRYGVSYRQSPVFRSGAFSDTMEIAAPWSAIPAVYQKVRQALGEHALVMAHFSHAYPEGSSIYFTFLGAESSSRKAQEVYDRAWRAGLGAALEAGATISHHHGVGRSKAPLLHAELGLGVSLVRGIQRAWDPDRILNPGALLPSSDRDPVAAHLAQPAIEFALDAASALVFAPGGFTLETLERELTQRGYTLGLESPAAQELTVSAWIAAGMPGARDPFSDPVESRLVGLTVRLAHGGCLLVRPSPRRAVGPDLMALFVGCGGELGEVEAAILSVRERGAPRSRDLPFQAEHDPPLSSGERAAWEQVVRALRS